MILNETTLVSRSTSCLLLHHRLTVTHEMTERLPVGPGRNIKSPKSVSFESNITSSDILNGCVDQVHSQFTFQELESGVSNSQLLLMDQTMPVIAVLFTLERDVQRPQQETGAKQKNVILVSRVNGLSKMSQVCILLLPPYLEVSKILKGFASGQGS